MIKQYHCFPAAPSAVARRTTRKHSLGRPSSRLYRRFSQRRSLAKPGGVSCHDSGEALAATRGLGGSRRVIDPPTALIGRPVEPRCHLPGALVIPRLLLSRKSIQCMRLISNENGILCLKRCCYRFGFLSSSQRSAVLPVFNKHKVLVFMMSSLRVIDRLNVFFTKHYCFRFFQSIPNLLECFSDHLLYV